MEGAPLGFQHRGRTVGTRLVRRADYLFEEILRQTR